MVIFKSNLTSGLSFSGFGVLKMKAASKGSELFQAGISMYPEGDNWSIVKLLEKMSDTKVEW